MLVVPDILVMVIVVMAIVVVAIVVVAVGGLHALGVLLLVQLRRVHHGQDAGNIRPGGVQNVVHPLLALAAVIEEHIRFADADHVPGRGLEAVRLPAGGHQQRHVHGVAADLADEVVVGEQGADHPQPAVLRRGLPPAGGQRCRQRQRQQARQQPLHSTASRQRRHSP